MLFNACFQQMRQLPCGGHFIRRLVLTQCEFLHPRTLNPWSKNCRNIAELAIYNCGEIPDDMFLGELPELDFKSFASLKTICFEGNSLSEQLLAFLIESATFITKASHKIN